MFNSDIGETMKAKRLIKYVGCSLIGALTLGVCSPSFLQTETANAATLTGIVFEDEFSEASLSNKWLKNDFCLDGGVK